jgi:hypothetical protein
MKGSEFMCQKVALFLLGAVLAAGNAAAHHAFTSEFDVKQPVKIEGEIVRVEWVNPHGWIHIRAKGAGGADEMWSIETGTPSALMRRGVTRQVLKPGVAIVLEGFRAKDGSRKANGMILKLADGRSLFLASSAPGTQKK